MANTVQEITHFAILDEEESIKFEIKGFDDGTVVIDGSSIGGCTPQDLKDIIVCLDKFKDRYFG